MKVICDRAAFLEAINLVAAVVPQRTPSPALSCVKITALKVGNIGEVTLAGTDAETSLQLGLTQVDVAQPGVTIVPAHKLQQIIGAVDQTDPTVTLELDGDQLHIRGANSRFKIFTFPASDFQPLPDFASVISGAAAQPARAVFSQNAGSLVKLMARTVFATARETSRYAINGVLLKRDGKKLEMVATDGRRLALSRTSVKGDGDGATSCIIPTKALGLFQRLASDAEAMVKIAITENQVFFGFEDGAVSSGDSKTKAKAEKPGATRYRAVLTSILVEGAFPPYEDVIPKDSDKKMTASTEELARAVRQASVLTNEESRGVRLSFSGKNKRLKLSSRAPEMGESEIDCSLTDYAGDDVEISFNPTFISDALKSVDEGEVILELKAPNKPGVFRVGTDFLYVVMPVNLPA